MPEVSLNLVTLRCADIDASAGFLSTLGLAVEETTHQNGSRFYQCRAGAQLIELFPRRRGPIPELRLGFSVENLPALLHQLIANDVEVVQTLGKPEVRYAVVKDPDGNSVELRG